MKNAIAIFCTACLARAALAVTMASQPWTTNRIAEAEARLSAQITAATNAIPRAEIPAYWPLYAVTNAHGTAVNRYDFDGLNIDGIGATASDAWQMATDALGGLSGVARAATNYTEAVASEFVDGTREVATAYSATVADNAANASFADEAETAQYLLGGFDKTVRWEVEGLLLASTNAAEAVVREMSLGGIWDSELEVWWTPVMRGGALRYETNAVRNAADALAAVSNVVASGGLASVDAVDTKISTNNAAFVSAVLAVPIAGADASDSAELAEYGSYGTVGAALLALIAGLAALKRRVTSAETALAQKADVSDLPYRLVEPGKWEFSGSGYDPTKTYEVYESGGDEDTGYSYDLVENGTYIATLIDYSMEQALSVEFNLGGFSSVIATRPSLPGHLCDRAGNRVVVSGDTTLTLPEANPGYLRDFLVRLEISGSTVPTITFADPTGETITYETDGDDFPVPDAAGVWLYSFTETAAHTFAVSLKKVNTVAQGGS